MRFVLIDKSSGFQPQDIHEILANRRLLKYLWAEILINPSLSEFFCHNAERFITCESVVLSAQRAYSWYNAYHSLFMRGDAVNKPLQRLAELFRLEAFKIKLPEYRQHGKEFLKALECKKII